MSFINGGFDEQDSASNREMNFFNRAFEGQGELEFDRMFCTLEDGILNLSLGFDDGKKFSLDNSKMNRFFSSSLTTNDQRTPPQVEAYFAPAMAEVQAQAQGMVASGGHESCEDPNATLTDIDVNRLPIEVQLQAQTRLDPHSQSYEFARLANEFKDKFDNLGLAINYYTKAIQLNSVEFRFYYNRSICLQQANLLGDALDDANAAIQLVPHARKPYLRKAELLVAMNRFSEAEQMLNQAFSIQNAPDLPVEVVQEELIKLIQTTLLRFGFSEATITQTLNHCNSIEQAMDFAFNRHQEDKTLPAPIYPPSHRDSMSNPDQYFFQIPAISKSLDSQDTADFYADEENHLLTPNRKMSFNEEQFSNGVPQKKSGFCGDRQLVENLGMIAQASNFVPFTMQGNGNVGAPFLGPISSRNGFAMTKKRNSLSHSEPLENFVKNFAFDPFMKNGTMDGLNQSEVGMMGNQATLYSKSVSSSFTNLNLFGPTMAPFMATDDIKVDPKYKEMVEKNNRCTNLIGYKGLWLGNISSNCSRDRLISIFRKYGDPIVHQLKKSPCAFIKYSNEKAPTDAIQDLHGKVISDIVHNKSDPLRLHFECNRRQQEENFPKNKLPRNFKNGECYFWRTVGCPIGKACLKIHVPINEKIDFQMWMLNDSNHKI